MTRRFAVLGMVAAPVLFARGQAPSARRKAIQKRLDELPPERRRQLERRYERFQQLPPERQERARSQFRKFSELQPDRRVAIRREMSILGALSEDERKKRMKSEDFQKRFNTREREVIEGMADLLATPK